VLQFYVGDEYVSEENGSTQANEAGEKAAQELAADAKPTQKPVPKNSKTSKSGSSSFVAWLALLCVLAIVAAGYWGAKELLIKEAGVNARLAQLEALAVAKDTSLFDLGQQWEARLTAQNAAVREAASRQTEQLQAIEGRLTAQRAELARFGATDRQDWLLAEAQYLLRLANQRLIMADDLVAAKALLLSADGILAGMEDVALHDVRAAVAADLAAVRAVPKRDIQGMYLVLAALIEQAGKLVIFQLPEQVSSVADQPAEHWQGRLKQGYESALLKLSDYIIIRRRDVPIEALMDPQWEGLVRQNLRMVLEQAQVALLSGNQTLFRESLARANHWVAEFFDADEAAALALSQEILTLQERKIAVEMPDISRSLAAVDVALERRMQRTGGE
jgi:uroporphyrin-3 C-methyltransferase